MLAAARLRTVQHHLTPLVSTLSRRTFTMSAPTPAPANADEPPRFPLSEVPPNTPVVRTAGCIVIGDEVLNGKTKDTNSGFLAALLFDLGIQLKRTEVIADDTDEIVEAVQRMHKNYDIVFTGGGIGPTHDDITYESIAKAFNVELEYDDETIKRMEALSKAKFANQTEEQRTARLRMALFPKGAERFFVDEELWVPVVTVGRAQKGGLGGVCILPGIPRLFQKLSTGMLSRYVTLPDATEKPFRYLIHTELPESSIAPFLTKLAAETKAEGIRVGSYPKMFKGVDVSLIGKSEDRLKELSERVVKELDGEVISTGKLGEDEKKPSA